MSQPTHSQAQNADPIESLAHTIPVIIPVLGGLMIFLLAFIGLVVSNVPYLVPPVMTVWEAASHPTSQIFYLVGAAILIPMIVGYTVVVFYLFRGKLEPGQGYH